MYDGTLVENWEALITFQQMIILCDSVGTIDMTPRALSSRTGIPLDVLTKGISVLEAKDPHSRTKDRNGVRIERIDEHRPWGWRIVNHNKYKKMISYEDKKESDRKRMELKRLNEKVNKNKGVASSRKESQIVEIVAEVAHADAYTNKDTNTNTKKERERPKKLSPLSELWNENCSNLPKVISITSTRLRKEKLRLKEIALGEWVNVFRKINLSAFCTGENDRGWKATYDWVIDNPENSIKVLEGKYDSKKKITRIEKINNEFEKFKEKRAENAGR